MKKKLFAIAAVTCFSICLGISGFGYWTQRLEADVDLPLVYEAEIAVKETEETKETKDGLEAGETASGEETKATTPKESVVETSGQSNSSQEKPEHMQREIHTEASEEASKETARETEAESRTSQEGKEAEGVSKEDTHQQAEQGAALEGEAVGGL